MDVSTSMMEMTADELSVDELSVDENKLEVTRNPFDSNLYDKDNFPILDASVFTDSRKSPDRKSTGGFRWSIDQIAKIQPADLDMCPNQEYSVVYERQEDEEKAQEKVDEYFKHVLLPSPWLDNRADILKRVTFSPHPPDTRYINTDVASAATEMSDGSFNTSSDMVDGKKKSNTKDVSCQTTLTLPFDFDLVSLIGKEYYTYVDETFNNNGNQVKEITASSLRRKLFDQDSGGNTPMRHMVGIASSANTPAYTTSSPTKEKRPSSDMQYSDGRAPSISPANAPGRADSSNIMVSPSMFGGEASSVECSPIKQASNIGTPVGKRPDLSFSSVDVSPISSCEKVPRELEIVEESNYSFLPDVSVDLEATEESVFESSRANRFQSPDLSPICNDASRNRIHRGMETTDSMEMSSNAQQLSIKESTARNFRALGGLELSSIVESSSKLDELQEDKGPLDITELQCEETDLSNNDQTNEKSEDDNSISPLQMTDLLCAPNLQDADDLDTPKIRPRNENTPSIEVTPSTPNKAAHSFSVTPLKGILKRRENPSSSNASSAENTKYNTERNSGRARSRILKTLEKENILPKPQLDDVVDAHSTVEEDEWKWKYHRSESSSLDGDLVCRRALSALKRSEKISNYTDEDIFDKENTGYSWPAKQHSTSRRYQLNSTAVVGSSIISSESLSQKIPDLSKLSSCDDVFSEVAPTDSGVSGMDWMSEAANSLKNSESKLLTEPPVTPKNELKSFSISPLMDLKQLNLRSGNTPWSQRKASTHHRSPYVYRSSQFLNRSSASLQSPAIMNRSASQLNRLMIYDRSHSWPSKHLSQKLNAGGRVSAYVSPPSRYSSPASKVFIPRSRVVPKTSVWKEHHEQKCLFKTSEATSSYKAFLPSPLK